MQDKVALVSGGARGQGEAHGRLLAEEGAKVVLGDVLDEAGEQAVQAMKDDGLDVTYMHLDVTSPENWDQAVATAKDLYGGLHVLVNNAGIVGTTASVTDETDDEWERILAVNQTAVYLGMQRTIPLMREAGGGSIINTSSVWGMVGTGDYIGYQATKGAVRLMTKSAAITYAPEKIRVNSVLPGLVMTPMIDDEPEDSIAELLAQTPMDRGCEPREISYGVLFLASDESSYVTGIDLVIDGGFLAQ
jgi:NAD(P)-dependent dehydrogenase (short-subunit alcohol dehydrogenase family)